LEGGAVVVVVVMGMLVLLKSILGWTTLLVIMLIGMLVGTMVWKHACKWRVCAVCLKES